MNRLLHGQSEGFAVLGMMEASDDDLALIAEFTGQPVTADDTAICEAVAFDNTRNANGWQIGDVNAISCLGAGLCYDHSMKAQDNHGTVFAERVEGNRKIVKIAIDKSAPKNADILSDLKFKPFTSPAIKVAEWKDEDAQIVGRGRLSHLSVVTDPAFGPSNRVLSLAASEEPDVVTDPFSELGKRVHGENVTAALRYEELRLGSLTDQQRKDARSKYERMDPMTLAEFLPILKENATLRKGAETSQQTVTAEHAVSSVRRPSNPQGLKLNIKGEDK